MTDDPGKFGFRVPMTPQTPAAVRLAGQRLVEYATAHHRMDIVIPDDEPSLEKDLCLLAWYCWNLEEGG